MTGSPTETLAPSPRGKKRSASTFSNNDDNKKARGRPRVEPKDQTAADRRRTQIRLAQRSYRERKEGTITELQSKVSQLESLVSEMNDSFQDLNRNAQTSNLGTANFNLSRQITEAAERYKELSQSLKYQKSSGSQGSSDESSTDPLEQPTSPAAPDTVARRPLVTSKKGPPTESTKNPPPTIVSTEERGVPAVWGYETLPEVSSDKSDGVTGQGAPVVDFPHNQPAQPPFSGGLGPTTNAVWQAIGPLTPYDNTYFNFSFGPASEMPSPMSYAALEDNFERRLHRTILEAGVRLLSSRNPPAARMKAIFGHVMKYYSQMELRDFFIECLNRGPGEPLESRAVYPYAGPYTQRLWYIETQDGKAREELLKAEDNKDDGTWFLPRDVNRWLAMKGIGIPRGAQYVDWEVETMIPQHPQYPPWLSPTSSVKGDSAHSSFDDLPASTFTDLDTTSHPIGNLVGGDPQWQPEYSFSMPELNNGMLAPPTGPADKWHKSRTQPQMRRSAPKYTLDVEQFVADVQFSTCCLGKCPGFRRRDVEKAFNNSLIAVAA